MGKLQIPWLRVFVEGVVIVGSILLAFGIDAWWERLNEEAEAAEALTALYSDLDATLRDVERNYEMHRRAYVASQELQDLLREAKLQGEPAVVPDTIVANAFLSVTLNPRTETLAGLLESGRLELIGDPELRSALRAWPARFVDIIEDEALSQSNTWNVLMPALSASGDLSVTFDQLLDDYSAEFEPAGPPGDTELVVSDELIGAVVTRRLGLVQAMYPMPGLISNTQEILEWIRPSLAEN